MRVALAILLAAFAAEARHAKNRVGKASSSSQTVGLGRSCKKNSDCRHQAQRCLRESDMNGKALDAGFCALPCLSLEAGTTKVIPGQPMDPALATVKKKAPPRCPPHFLCRGADAGSPIDMCVKE